MEQMSDQLFHKSIINTLELICLVDFFPFHLQKHEEQIFTCLQIRHGSTLVFTQITEDLCMLCADPPSRNKNKIKTPSKPAALEKGICTNEAYRHASSVCVCVCAKPHRAQNRINYVLCSARTEGRKRSGPGWSSWSRGPHVANRCISKPMCLKLRGAGQ